MRRGVLTRAPPAPARWSGRSAARARGTTRSRRRSAAGVEIRPEQVGEIELGVGELPQQEVRNPLLAAGADEEVGLRRVGHREERLDRLGTQAGLVVQRLGIEREVAARRLRDVPAPAVIRGDRQREPRVGGGLRLAGGDRARGCADRSATCRRSPGSGCRSRAACATSCSSARRKSSIRIDTSSAGRRQFSLENANSVRNSTPRSRQARTTPRTASTPLRWPATRGSSRCFAQRPLPSMMIATCRGTARVSGMSRVELLNKAVPRVRAMGGRCRDGRRRTGRDGARSPSGRFPSPPGPCRSRR